MRIILTYFVTWLLVAGVAQAGCVQLKPLTESSVERKKDYIHWLPRIEGGQISMAAGEYGSMQNACFKTQYSLTPRLTVKRCGHQEVIHIDDRTLKLASEKYVANYQPPFLLLTDQSIYNIEQNVFIHSGSSTLTPYHILLYLALDKQLLGWDISGTWYRLPLDGSPRIAVDFSGTSWRNYRVEAATLAANCLITFETSNERGPLDLYLKVYSLLDSRLVQSLTLAKNINLAGSVSLRVVDKKTLVVGFHAGNSDKTAYYQRLYAISTK